MLEIEESGHKEDTCLGNVMAEERNRRRQPKTWIDNIKEDMKVRNMDMRSAMDVTQDREKWRGCTTSSSANLTNEKQEEKQELHDVKQQATATTKRVLLADLHAKL